MQFGFCSGSVVYTLYVCSVCMVGLNAVWDVGNQLVDCRHNSGRQQWDFIVAGVFGAAGIGKVCPENGSVIAAQQYAMPGTQTLLRACCW